MLWSGSPAVVDGGEPRVFAVMEDDTVLCADCAHEATGEGVVWGAGSLVHAWVEAAPGVCCGWCGEGGWLA